MAVAAQELNGTAGEYAQAEQTEEAAVQTEETEQTEEMTEQSDGTKQSEEIAVQSEATEAVEETTEQTEETQTKTDELRQELLQLLEQKTVMATVDLYEVREEPDADSAVEGSLPSGSQVLLKDVAIDGGSVWYYVMFAVDGQERYGYIEAAHLVTSDTDFRAWEEKLGAADEVAGEAQKERQPGHSCVPGVLPGSTHTA